VRIKMTLHKIIEIVADAVERTLCLSRLHVEGLSFNERNRELVRRAACSINGASDVFVFENRQAPPPDVVVIDAIPSALLPRLALGLFEDELSRGLFGLIRNEVPILVLCQYGSMERLPRGLAGLTAFYLEMLKGYGVVFLDQMRSEPGYGACQSGQDAVFRENVLSRQALLRRGSSGSLVLSPGVVVTNLAEETARDMGITIIRETVKE